MLSPEESYSKTVLAVADVRVDDNFSAWHTDSKISADSAHFSADTAGPRR
jgi:hypothetical protein